MNLTGLRTSCGFPLICLIFIPVLCIYTLNGIQGLKNNNLRYVYFQSTVVGKGLLYRNLYTCISTILVARGISVSRELCVSRGFRLFLFPVGLQPTTSPRKHTCERNWSPENKLINSEEAPDHHGIGLSLFLVMRTISHLDWIIAASIFMKFHSQIELCKNGFLTRIKNA